MAFVPDERTEAYAGPPDYPTFVMNPGQGSAKSPSTTALSLRAELPPAEARFRALLASMPGGAALLDERGRVVHVNRALCDYLCARPEACLGTAFEDAVKPGDRPAVRELLRRLASGEIASGSLRARLDGLGRDVDADLTAAALPGDRGSRPIVVHLEDATERRRSEEALSLYREIFRASSDGIAIVDLEGRYLEQNAAHRTLLGWNDEDLAQRTPSIHLGEETFARVVECLRTTGRFRGEVQSRTRDGRTVPVELSAFTLTDEEGRPVCHVGIKRDMSTRKAAEAALERRIRELTAIHRLTDELGRARTLPQVYEAAFACLQETLGENRFSILLYDEGGVMRFVAWRGISTEYRAAVEGHSPWNRDDPDPKPLFVPDVQADPALASYGPLFARESIRSLAFIPLRNQGELLGKFMVYREGPHDVDDDETRLVQTIANHVAFAIVRTRADEALRASEATLSDFFENAPLGLHWVNSDGVILWANRAELAMLGYAKEEYVGQNIAEFHVDQDVIADILRRLRAGEVLEGVEARLRAKDGSIRHVVINTNARFENGEFLHTRCFTRDITDLKAAESQREAAQARDRELARLREVDSVRSRLVNTAAHELNTPLTPIRLQIDLLQSGVTGPLSSKQTRALEILDRNVRRLDQLVQDMLEAARLQANRLGLERRPVDLTHLVAQAAESFREPARRAGITFVVRRSPAAIVEADTKRLTQVLVNLVANALKFTRSGGRVELGVRLDDGHAIAFVRDTGIGIDPSLLPRLFEPFSQVHDRTELDPPGTGLGLYISRGLVELHGGRAWAESAGRGRGSVFSFSVPLAGPA